MLGTCDPKMLKTQPVPFEVHNLLANKSVLNPTLMLGITIQSREMGGAGHGDGCPAEQALRMQEEQELEGGRLVSVEQRSGAVQGSTRVMAVQLVCPWGQGGEYSAGHQYPQGDHRPSVLWDPVSSPGLC